MPRPGFAIIARVMVAVLLSSLVIAETPAERVVRSLKKAGYFSVWGVGVAAAVSPNEQVFRIFMNQNPTAADAIRLIAEGTPAARIYGFLALQKISPQQFAELAPRHLHQRTDVLIRSGCVDTVQTSGSLVRLISEGKIAIRPVSE